MMKKLPEMVTHNVRFTTYIEFVWSEMHVDQTSVDYIEPPLYQSP